MVAWWSIADGADMGAPFTCLLRCTGGSPRCEKAPFVAADLRAGAAATPVVPRMARAAGMQPPCNVAAG
ncbi:hypothetical protein GCM10010211_11920 [Streptomyces albospinus]|uniref:Uncharacterized protein n=1 Tax=Streptomyces albospinus TaxID=285515 RepID=A0ABQ2USC5_9ACTN|nr:hypothetical protein GCM10010211_11920 [Streptomyces albospinus]